MSSHYKEIDGHKLTDFIHELPFYLGNIMKYAWRAPYKGGIDDIIKLLDYIAMSRKSWCKYALSNKTYEYLHEISGYEFYSKCDGLERAHRRCIGHVASLIINSECCDSIDDEDRKLLIASTKSLQEEILHKQI